MGPKRSWDDTQPPLKARSGLPFSDNCSDIALTPTEIKDSRFRELYSKPLDFMQLARSDPDMGEVMKEGQVDFGDPVAVIQLTKTLLKLDFALSLQLPPNRLCPPVQNRHNYILWLKGLLDSSSYGPPSQTLLGLDIGTGASCIFPLLGCTQRPWSFIATGEHSVWGQLSMAKLLSHDSSDIDSESVEWAKKNVQLNGLDHRIKILQRKAEDRIIPIDELGIETMDFAMTNPPFYASEEQMLQSANRKSRPPWTVCTGAPVEMVVDGGELAFVSRILDESLRLGCRVRWYTSMLGFLSSVSSLVGQLKEHHIENYAITELTQGKKTRRWAVAWSFASLRPDQQVARGIKAASLLPALTEVQVVHIPQPKHIGEFVRRLSAAIAALSLISWDWNAQMLAGTGRAADRVWTRAWRRKQKREGSAAVMMKDGTQSQSPDLKAICVLGFRVNISVGLKHIAVSCRWLEGLDASAFESFQGFLQTTAKSALEDTQSLQ